MPSSNVFTFSANSYSFIYRLMDLCVLFSSLIIAVWLYDLSAWQDHLIAFLAVSVVFLYMAESVAVYSSWRTGYFTEMVSRVWACISVSFLIVLMVAFLLEQLTEFSRVTMGLWFFLSLFLSFLWRELQCQYIKACHKAGFYIKRVAIIGATNTGNDLLQEMVKRDELGYDFVGVYDDRHPNRVCDDLKSGVDDKIEQAIKLARAGQIDILFIALPLKAEKRIADLLLRLGDTTVDVHYIPDFLVSILTRSRFSNVGDVDTLSVFESPYIGAKQWVKRCEDIVLSSLILILISVPLVIIAITIKLTSPGPILFKQHRYGLCGEKITVWKFRSMRVMEDGDKVVQATKGDPRITPFGAFLRRTSLDEFPQFFNVLTGSMSIVGPRPHAVAHNEEYRSQVQFYMLRHKVKPGITGWAQVNGWRGETDTLAKMESRIEFDLQYIKYWSLWLDIKIIFLTLFKGFTNPNAY